MSVEVNDSSRLCPPFLHLDRDPTKLQVLDISGGWKYEEGPSRPPKHVTGLPVDEPVEIRWDCVGIMNKALGGVEIPFVLGV